MAYMPPLPFNPPERSNKLLHWQAAPSAGEARPREDHLIPLMIAVGAAEQRQGECVYREDAFMAERVFPATGSAN